MIRGAPGCFAILILLSVGCVRQAAPSKNQEEVKANSGNPWSVDGDGRVNLGIDKLDESLVAFANHEYGLMEADYDDPDNSVGTPPFTFVNRIECQVIPLDSATEKVIKRYSETVTFHALLILRDARKDLYVFTVTSTVPDKREVFLRSFGPLTNENPEVVQLPISRRRLTEFPIDFQRMSPVDREKGRCIFVPYPFPADQDYWLFGEDPKSSKLQGLYRNDRYENVQQLIELITRSVKLQKEL